MAQEKSVFDIIFATKKTGDAPKELAGDLDKATEAAKRNEERNKRLNIALKAVQGAAIAAGVAFLRSVPAMVQQGNTINKAMSALKAYAGGAKEAQEAIDAVVAASNNSISDFQAAETANRFFAMGLANSAQEAAKLTEMAITLGAAMGKDAAGAVEEFGLLLANQSVQRLDTFGVSAAKVRERMAELAKETGNTDREFLFMTATMEIAQEQLDTLSEAGFEATDNVARLSATVENIKNQMIVWLSDGLMPIIDGFFLLQDAVKSQQDAIFEANDDYDEWLRITQELMRANPSLVSSMTLLTREQFESAKAAETAALAQEALTAAEEEGVKAAEEMVAVHEELALSMDAVNAAVGGKLGPAIEDHAQKVGLLTARNDVLKKMLVDIAKDGFDPLSDEVIAITEEINKNEDAILKETEALKKLTSEIIFNQIASELNAEAALELGRALGLVDEQTFNTAIAAEELSRKWDAMDGVLDGVITDTAGFAAEAALLRDTMAGIPAEVVTTIKVNTITTNVITDAFQAAGDRGDLFTGGRPFDFGPQATGGIFEVKGSGGNDRIPIRANVSDGEKVQFIPRTGADPSGGGLGGITIENVNLGNSLDIDMFTNKLKGLAQ